MKNVSLVALMIVAVLCLWACSAPSEPEQVDQVNASSTEHTKLDPTDPATVTLWHYYVGENQQALEQAVSQFNQTEGIEKGVIVEPVAKGSIAELEEDVTDSAKGVINSSPMPDIFSSYPDKAYEIDQLGLICDLREYFSDEETARYVPDFFADGVFEGDRVLLAPVVKSTELMYVNATEWDAFKQAEDFDDSALETWEGVREAARAYYRWTDSRTPDVAWDGTGFMGFDSVANYIIVGNKQQGIDIIDGDEKQAVLDKTALHNIYDIYTTGIALGYFDEVGKFRSDDIKSGDLVSYVGSSSSAAYFPTWIEDNNTRLDIDFLALPYPTFEGGESYAIQQGAGMCIAKTDEKKQEGAALFLKWFTAPEQNIDFAMTTGYLPVQSAAYESQSFTDVLEQLQTGEKAQQNVADVYEIALHQITEANTYAVKPFENSYDVRSLLQRTLIDSGTSARQDAVALKEGGASEDEILTQLDMDSRFERWITTITDELDQRGISYSS